MNGTALRVFRVISLVVSALLCCIAVTLLIIGVATPSWLYVDYRVPPGVIEEHRHGLWLDCVLRGGGGQNPYAQSSYFNWGVTSDQCEYKWVNIDPSPYGGGGGGGGGMDPYLSNSGGYSAMSSLFQTDYSQHRFLAWHVSTLICLIIAITAGVFAIFACLCVFFTTLCSAVAALLEFVAFLSSAIGVSIFFINANRPEIRYTQIPNAADRWRVYDRPPSPWFPPSGPDLPPPGIWGGDGGFGRTVFRLTPDLLSQHQVFGQQMRGFSFDLSLASVFIFLLSCLLGVLGSVVGFMHAQQQHQRRRHRRMDSKTFPKTELSTVSSSANDHNSNHHHHQHNEHSQLSMTNMANQPHLIRIRNEGAGASVIRDNSIGV